MSSPGGGKEPSCDNEDLEVLFAFHDHFVPVTPRRDCVDNVAIPTSLFERQKVFISSSCIIMILKVSNIMMRIHFSSLLGIDISSSNFFVEFLRCISSSYATIISSHDAFELVFLLACELRVIRLCKLISSRLRRAARMKHS